MLSVRGVRNACPRRVSTLHSSMQRAYRIRAVASNLAPISYQRFSTTHQCRQEAEAHSSAEDIEKVVREAKQRFRDTLPKGYLTEKEYELYERLYGAPLRETAPEDVGIPEHADMGKPENSRPLSNEGTLLRQLEGGEFEEVAYEINRDVQPQREEEDSQGTGVETVAEQPRGYVDAVARNQREYDALSRLMKDFEIAQERQHDADIAAAAKEADNETEPIGEQEPEWPEEDSENRTRSISGAERRFHPLTLEGRFHDSPVEIILPREELIKPIHRLLSRSHTDHVKAAAESAFDGPGLPTSPATPDYKKNGHMGPVGLSPDSRHMTEIEADAFLAAFIPPAYASVLSILREVRKRVGGEWLQSRLKNSEQNELSVLDVGTGGAALLAWEQIVNAEWEVLKEAGEVKKSSPPPGKKTAVVSSDRLQHRVKEFLQNTSLLPRLPDYVHSGEMKSGQKHIDASDTPQPRKSYDVVIASHMFLKEKQEYKRKELMENLWTMVKKDGGILIVVEKAHPRGFEAMAEVRDTLLTDFIEPQPGQPSLHGPEVSDTPARKLEPGHIVAPCPNQVKCPMYKIPGVSPGRKDYCHFGQRFVRPAFYVKMFGENASNAGEVEFSYFALQRGVAKSLPDDGKALTERAFEGFEKSSETPDFQSLPRILLPSLKRRGHITMDVCTPEGTTERWTVPKSFSKLGYHDARKSSWGDIWALGAKTRVSRNLKLGRGVLVPDNTQKFKNIDEKVRIDKFRGKSRKAQQQEMHRDSMLEGRRQEHEDLLDEINDDMEDQQLEIESMQRQALEAMSKEDKLVDQGSSMPGLGRRRARSRSQSLTKVKSNKGPDEE